ncbi:MAG: flagellar basal body L-ring protein FlgH [Pseudomonadota bacterium]|uniref:flagellar basal body L-ring protein FlgH n=1 Tax=Gallaecimonas pentaromativorans TaxID=584787 RepID=UPI00067EE88D|nr:flagellar basal body L-ring protein FlgH [Gallaecimonas pentaromativorans]MED5526716.1 flagellar basal body L-ring protein FlgH [Pseudomonadota bacterium]
MRSLAVLTLMVLGGCATYGPKPIPDDPDFAPVLPAFEEKPLVATGSMYYDAGAHDLYADRKAARVGDIITVMLEESTSAKKSSTTELKKKSAVDLPAPTVMGRPVTINGNTLGIGISGNNDFKGESDADQANQLSGAISVHVIRVLPNGTLMVRGEKWITLNNGDEYVRLTGVVRQDDITADNTVSSTRVANARIQYSGTGAFADVQKQGWLARFFNSPLWPF